MSGKKKLSPMAWEEVQAMNFTDKQWAAINTRLQLPNEARALIERIVSLYSFHEANHAGCATRSEALSELETIEQLAKRLSLALKKIDARNWYALIDTVKDADWRSMRETWYTRIETVHKIATDIPEAVKLIQKQKPGRPGPNSFAIDHLVKQLDDIVRRFKGRGISRGQIYTDFVVKLAKIADPDIGEGTIEAAIKRTKKAN